MNSITTKSYTFKVKGGGGWLFKMYNVCRLLLILISMHDLQLTSASF